METKARLTLCAICRVPADGIAAFQRYEEMVLSLLRDHNGILERRLRTEDGTTEVHVISFPAGSDFDAYRADPRRVEHATLLELSGATVEVLNVMDIEGETTPTSP